MTKNEKIFMIDCLLRDIRLSWAKKEDNEKRCALAMSLCQDLGGDFLILAQDCNTFYYDLLMDDSVDGRYFRDEFPHGYYDLDKIHRCSFTLSDKSRDIKKAVSKYIVCPECLFSDVEDRKDVEVLQKIKQGD